MESTCSPDSNSIGVLVADSNQMQSQLLVRELRRRPEFQVTSCPLDPDEILRVVGSVPVERRFSTPTTLVTAGPT